MSSDDGEAVVGLIFLTCLGIYLICALFFSLQMYDTTVTVNEKVPVSPFKIIDDNSNMYVIQDQWQIGYFNSGDTYSKIKEGSTYNITTSGIRFPFFSWFPNVIKIQKV